MMHEEAQLDKDIALKIINDLYLQLENTSKYSHKASITYNIIELKNNIPDTNNLSKYRDIKRYITYSIQKLAYETYNYDHFNFTKFEELMSDLNANQKFHLFKQLENQAIQHGEFDIAEISSAKKNKQKLECYNKRPLYKFFKHLLYLPSQNSFSLCCCLVSIYFIGTLFLAPAPLKCMEVITYTPNTYATNPILNHFLNSISIITCLPGTPDLIPISFLGVFAVLVAKTVFYIIIVNYIIKEIEKKVTI